MASPNPFEAWMSAWTLGQNLTAQLLAGPQPTVGQPRAGPWSAALPWRALQPVEKTWGGVGWPGLSAAPTTVWPMAPAPGRAAWPGLGLGAAGYASPWSMLQTWMQPWMWPNLSLGQAMGQSVAMDTAMNAWRGLGFAPSWPPMLPTLVGLGGLTGPGLGNLPWPWHLFSPQPAPAPAVPGWPALWQLWGLPTTASQPSWQPRAATATPLGSVDPFGMSQMVQLWSGLLSDAGKTTSAPPKSTPKPDRAEAQVDAPLWPWLAWWR